MVRVRSAPEEWDRALGAAGDRAVFDETDIRGYKNEYIDIVLKKGVERAVRFTGRERVLDFGCGGGVATRWLAGRTGFAAGVDYSLEGVRLAVSKRTRAGEGYAVYDGRTFPFRDASFDLVHCRGVFVCIEDRRTIKDIAAEMSRCLRPGGKLILVEGVSRTPGKFRYGRKEYVDFFTGAGFRREFDYPLRKGRWPGLYLIRFGLVPQRLFGPIAEAELAVRKRSPVPLLDYMHHLFVFARQT